MEKVFTLISDDDLGGLAIKVKDKIDQGWVILGEINAVVHKSNDYPKDFAKYKFHQELFFVI